MNKSNIIIDVDGVILDFNAGFTKWWNDKYSSTYNYVLPYNPNTWDYDWPHEISILKNTMKEYIDSDPIFNIIDEKIPILINELSKNYKIIIVTAYHRRESRIKNLELFCIKYDDIHFTQNTNKVEIIKSLNPVMILEDCPLHIKDLADENAEYDIYVPAMWNYTMEVHDMPKVILYFDLSDLGRKILV